MNEPMHTHPLVCFCLTALHKVCHHVPVLLLQKGCEAGPLGGAMRGCIILCHSARHLALHVHPATV